MSIERRLFSIGAVLLFIGAFVIALGGEPRHIIKPARAWTHGSFVVPPPAASVGFNTLTRSYRFSSLGSIDTTKSKAAGFDWYISNAWPNATTPSGGWTGINTATDTDPATLSTSANSLVISTGIANVNQGVHTAVASGASWLGTAFNGSVGGAYFNITMGFDPSITPGASAWPIAWLVDLRFLIGQVSRHTELDLYERKGPPPTFAVHDWDMATNPATDNGNSSNWTVSPDVPSSTALHQYGTLWQTVTKGGGTGSVQRYVDGVQHSFNTVTWTAGAQYSTLDAGILTMILDAGGSVPTSFQVDVWQASSAGVTVQ